MATRSFIDNLPKLRLADGSPIRAEVVDDEPHIADLICWALDLAGWETRAVHDGETAIKVAQTFLPHLIVVDFMLPGCNGNQVLEEIKKIRGDIPSLMISAKDTVEDRVSGLQAGHDDYVTKPFSMEETILRIFQIARRSGITKEDASVLVVGDLVLDHESHQVMRGGREITLTATEFQLLRYLMENPKRVLRKDQILDRVWNYDFGGQHNIVELYISYLRKKLDPLDPEEAEELKRTGAQSKRPPLIHTVRGAGYVLKPAEPETMNTLHGLDKSSQSDRQNAWVCTHT